MAIQEWDGVIAKLKISGSVYPELFNDLHSVPQRERGERLRLLAYIGLQMVKMGALPVGAVGRNGNAVDSAAGPSKAVTESHGSDVNANTLARRNKLLGSIKN
ncbi:MAG: hypothetical protein E7K47_08885 [Acidovorax sp.]|jgi:hypothetical protein|nr:hypothetical protein [Acidovorax sp.]TFI47033.1 hypothetical protein E4O93_14770 [Diaphorobacter sp. DS2]